MYRSRCRTRKTSSGISTLLLGRSQLSMSTRHGRPRTDVERRVLIDEFIEEITVLPDDQEVKVHGAPALHVLYQEVGMKKSDFDRVGGGT
jgi:hypothetical protein